MRHLFELVERNVDGIRTFEQANRSMDPWLMEFESESSSDQILLRLATSLGYIKTFVSKKRRIECASNNTSRRMCSSFSSSSTDNANDLLIRMEHEKLEALKIQVSLLPSLGCNATERQQKAAELYAEIEMINKNCTLVNDDQIYDDDEEEEP